MENEKRNAFLLFFILLTTLACQTFAKKDAEPPTEVYLGLRNIWFTTKPEEMGIKTEPGSHILYAVVMDIGMSGGSVTITSSIAGEASMYTSTGGGILGGGEHENVKNAAIKFVQVSADLVSKIRINSRISIAFRR